MSYTQGILVSVSSILNNSLVSKQTVGFFPTLHGTIQTIAIQTITASEAIILKSKQTQGFFPTRQRNSFGFPLPERQLVCRFNLKLIFLLLSFFFHSHFSFTLLLSFCCWIYSSKQICCSSLVHYSTGDFIFTFDFDRADSLSEHWVFSRPSN